MERRFVTPVKIGRMELASDKPVLVQSMLNTSTMDTEACINQAIEIIEAGGELVRITAQGLREAENLKNIKAGLLAKGYDIPISADIHFVPEAAMIAARYVDKVRINPGNFIDKRAVFNEIEYTDESYALELKRLDAKMKAFVDICKKYGTAIRIGTNHGSLSDRIMSRYGDTPEGMVEATMEFLRICKRENFDRVVISMKSSICSVMYRSVLLLLEAMDKEDMHYPLHLGVTEAGEGEDGRIKSALGIGSLLCRGIGDTIRVSLTENPAAEIPVAKALVNICTGCAVYNFSMTREKTLLTVSSSETDEALLELLIPARVGSVLLDGGIKELKLDLPGCSAGFAEGLSKNIMQAAGLKRFKTEFVSCPGCGRTMYDLQKAVSEVKKEFARPELSALKIAIMGCIVNGPGEMGDADYGYVGAGNGKVNLYKGKKLMKKAVPENEAIACLKELMRAHGENI